MSIGLSTGDIVGIVQLCLKIQDVHDTLAASYGRDDTNRVAMVLESSKQKLGLWKNTWLGDASNAVARSQVLWGKEGWIDVQKLLAEIETTLHQFKPAEQENVKTSPKPFWRRPIFGQPKKPRTVTLKSPSILDLALELDKNIDELWMYSEVVFESLHGLLAQSLGPPARDQHLAQSIPVRQGALALYHACQRSKTRCDLDIDLFGTQSTPFNSLSGAPSASSTTDTSIFYHMFIECSYPKPKMGDVTIQSLTYPETATKPLNVEEYEQPSLKVFKVDPSSKARVICIKPKSSGSGSYFRVTKLSTATTPISESENLAQILYRSRISTQAKTLQPLSLAAKLDLAYKVVQCGFYLLGTPWLASLSSKQLRRIETKSQSAYVLGLQKLSLEDLYFQNPDALAEPTQLFRIGILLMEIALGNPDHSDPAEVEEPYLRASKMLPLVRTAVGSQYCKACAFCIQDRRSTPFYGRPEKYQYPEKTGWDIYLRDLLEDYHAQVLSRFQEIREIAGSPT
ncbi:MAG: hypothetical protein Q9217_001692 [Psora testacea]